MMYAYAYYVCLRAHKGKHYIIDCEAINIISAKPIHHQALCADIIQYNVRFRRVNLLCGEILALLGLRDGLNFTERKVFDFTNDVSPSYRL